MNIKKFIGGLFMTKEQKLNKQVEQQEQALSKLNSRISQLVDRIHTLEGDVDRFKTKVGQDMQVVYNGVTKLSEIVKKDKTL
jgi:cell division protein FtsB